MTAEKKPLKNPEISVIVPVYKVEKYLNECIDSILAQTFTDFEVILVDDGSPDNCPALCDAAAEKDSRVRVIHKANGGVSTARNAGLAAARGNWVGFVDSDDVIDKTYLEKLYCAAKQSGAEIAACNMLFMQEDGIPCRYQEQPLCTEILSQDEAIHRMRLTPLIQAATRLHRRDILEGVVFPVGKNYEDAFTTPEIFERATAVACVEEKLYHYRVQSASIMHGKANLKNLDEIDANYGLLQCTLRHGKKDAAYLQYALMKRYFRNIKKQLSPELLQDARVKRAETLIAQAKMEIRQSGACTLRNVLETAFCFVAPQRYHAYKYHRNTARKETAR